MIWHVNGLLIIEIKNSIGIVTLKNQLNKMNSLNVKQVLRNLKNNKFYSFITIFGLAVGMAATILLFIYTQHEFSYDRFHKNYERIYRLNSIISGDSKQMLPICLRLNDSLLQARIPEIEELFQMYSYGGAELISENVHYKNIPLMFSDPNIHRVFTLKYLVGNPDVALIVPGSLVLTRSVSEKIFGSIDVIGKIIKCNDFEGIFTITGVIEDFPQVSHIKIEAIAPLKSLPSYLFNSIEFLTYVKYKQNANIEDGLEKTVSTYNSLLKERFGKSGFSSNSFILKISDLHLKADFNSKNGFDAPLKKVYIYIVMALIVLLIAIINFINLLTVQYEGKSKDIGVQKTIGASRKDIIIHFLSQSIGFSFIALIIAAILVEFFIPAFGSILNRDLVSTYRHNIILIIGLPLFALATGIISGIYPALIISKYPPLLAIKGNKNRGVNKFNKTLVIVQFSIAIFLIACLLVINRQVDYLKNADLGFGSENVVAIDGISNKIGKSYPAILDALGKIPGIKSISSSVHLIGGGTSGQSISIVGSSSPLHYPINEYRIGYGFIETLGFKIISGRSFDKNIESDKNGIILNEKAVKMLGLSDPLKTEIMLFENKKQIIGVVKDFQYSSSFEQGVEPIMFTIQNGLSYIMLKISDSNIKGVLYNVEKVIKEFDSQYTMEYINIEDFYQSKYKSYKQTETLSAYASTLSLILALLGLYALSMFMVQKRTKEVGIRKVSGASRLQIIQLLLTTYTRQVIIAFIIATPAAYFVLDKWLNNFAYRIDLTPFPFIISGLLALVVASITVAGQTWKAAGKNPVDSLRNE